MRRNVENLDRFGATAQDHRSKRPPEVEAAAFDQLAACKDVGAEFLVGAFESRGRVHAVAERGVLDAVFAAEVADDRLAPVQPDPGASDWGQVGAGFSAKALARLPDRVAGARDSL